VQEGVDQVAVTNLFGQIKETDEKLIQLDTTLLGNSLNRTAPQSYAFRQTLNAVRDKRKAKAEFLVQFREFSMAPE
jgi:hypothetical protein